MAKSWSKPPDQFERFPVGAGFGPSLEPMASGIYVCDTRAVLPVVLCSHTNVAVSSAVFARILR